MEMKLHLFLTLALDEEALISGSVDPLNELPVCRLHGRLGEPQTGGHSGGEKENI